MKILILGGTRFLGRFLSETAIARGHELTLFNRGKENPELFPEAEKLRGDRNGDLAALEGKQWDAVIDTCGFMPRTVRDSAQLLRGSVSHYTFISSISVYDELEHPGIDEQHPISRLPLALENELMDEPVSPVDGRYYGELKFLCEEEVRRAFPDHHLIVRPGLIVGPHDETGRFGYWVERLVRGGEVLAPGRKDKQVQFIDVRDLAEWIIRLVEKQTAGTFNATGPTAALTMEDFLEHSKVALGSGAKLVWVEEEFLLEQEVGYWLELPLWVPDREKMAGFLSANITEARQAGLVFRPLEETVRAVHDWEAGRTGAQQKAGLDPEKERAVLEAWQRRGEGSGK